MAQAAKKTPKPRGWVFTKENNPKREVGFAEPGDYRNGEIAVEKFGRQYGGHFSLYFRDSNGELQETGPEDRPEDFD